MSAQQPSSIGRYEIISRLGQGGMGMVYLAHDPVIERLVAIKCLRTDDEEVRMRFLREARSAGRLKHRNIVTIFDVGEAEGTPYIVMEHVTGDSIASVIAKGEPVPLGQMLTWSESLCDGLEFAHRGGIVHRDIKPANLLIDADGVLKILDFGVAKLADLGGSDTRADILIGSPNYMSPEQLAGAQVDQRSDIFSAGAVLYELLTLQKAFSGESLVATFTQITTSAPRPLDELVANIDSHLVAIVQRALAKDREQRFATAAAMQAALVQFRGSLELASLNAPLQLRAQKTAVPPPIPAGDPPLSDQHSPLSLDLGQTCVAPAPQVAAQPAAGPQRTEALEVPAPQLTPAVASNAGFDRTIVFRKTASLPTLATVVPDVQLVVTRAVDNRLVGQTFRLGTETIRIGRATDNDWSLPERSWSRHHAEVRYSAGGYVLRDVGSQNGVFIHGRRVTETPLLFGTTIQIGALEVTFSQMGDASLQDFTGCQIADRYTLVRLLRESSKGAVYEASDARTSANVAIKLLSPALLQYPGYRDQFQREAKIAARLNHPYICRVADYGPATLTPSGGAPMRTEFLCFELMAGGSLVERIESKAAIPPARVAEWLEPIADALEYAHRHEVLHGDLKPSAIVFDDEEHPYLTDFSMAQQVSGGEGRQMTGTPAYMAPELWLDGVITAATEQFALAAITYYLVTGSRPFEGQEHHEVRQRNFRRGPPPAHEEAAHNQRPEVPRAVSQVLARGLAPDPAKRYDSLAGFASAFRDGLRRIVHKAEGPEIFISYQRNVSAMLAMYLADKLRTQGIHAFVDAQGLDGAGPFPPHIERAIEDSDVFVCLLAETTLHAEWVLREIRLAQQYAKPMIPIMQESYNRGGSTMAEPAVAALLGSQGLLVFDKRNLHLEHTVTDLVRLIRSAIGQRDRV